MVLLIIKYFITLTQPPPKKNKKKPRNYCWKQIWVPTTRPDEVPKHNQISVKRRNRENHMGKTLLQKEMEFFFPENKNKRMIMKNTTKVWSYKHCQTIDLKNLHCIKDDHVEKNKSKELINQRWNVSSWPPKIGMKECLYGKQSISLKCIGIQPLQLPSI